MAITAVAVLATVPALAEGAESTRHYELVSPVEKFGQEARIQGISPDGRTVSFDSTPGNGMPGAPSHDIIRNVFISRRTPSGWQSDAWNPSAAEFVTSDNYSDASPDLGTQLFRLSTPQQVRNGEVAMYVRRNPTDPPERISPILRNRAGSSSAFWPPVSNGATPDFSHLLLTMVRPGTLLDTDLPFESSSGTLVGFNLYEVAEAGTPQATLRRVDVGNQGEQLGAFCGARFGGYNDVGGSTSGNAISADGRRIFFTAAPAPPDAEVPACGTEAGWETVIRLFARVDGASTVELSASECDRTPDPGAEPPVEACGPESDAYFEAASEDGQRVWFTTRGQLVDGDVDSERDLYVYDFAAPDGQRLTQVSSRTGMAAGVQSVVAASADGSRVYFMATGVLADNQNASGTSAVDGQSNVYLYDVASGETIFVATIDPFEKDQWVRATTRPVQLADDDGQVLVLSTSARLTTDDTDAVSDVFRFDAGDRSLVRVSTGQPGRGNDDAGSTTITSRAKLNGNVDAATSNRMVSRDGQRVVFVTAERLLDEDQSDAADVYEWHDGVVRLVSDGRQERGQARFFPRVLISDDGSSVVFDSPRALLPQDRDTSTDVYAARLGDDVTIPTKPEDPICVVGVTCQGSSEPPPAPPTPQTPLFAGPGNLALPSPPATSPMPRVRKPGTVRGSRTTLRVTVAGAGRLRAAGSGVRATAKTVAKAGVQTVRVALTSRAAATLRRKGQVRVAVRLTFTAKGATPAVARTTVTFKRTKQQAAAKRSAS